MDEGTSHLDTATERQVTAAVKALGLTRVIIAHRPETVAGAQRVVQVVFTPQGGQVVELVHAVPPAVAA